MKTAIFSILCSFAVLTACNKTNNSTNPPVTGEVVYQVLNAEHSITEVEYNDGSGNSVHGDPNTQTDSLWTKTISSSSSFHAELKADFHNTKSTPINYSMAIYINGTLKKKETGQVLPNSTLRGSVEYESE